MASRNGGQAPRQPVVMRGPVVAKGKDSRASINAGNPVVNEVLGCPVKGGRKKKGGTLIDSSMNLVGPRQVAGAGTATVLQQSTAPRWHTSEAKRHILARLEDPSDNIHTMTLDEIYHSSAFYREFKKTNFMRNVRNLQGTVSRQCKQADFDRQAVEKLPPRAELTERGYPFWDKSEAQRILRQSLSSGQIDGMKPFLVYNQNEEYRKFPLRIFRNQLYKEKNRMRSAAYWQLRNRIDQTKDR